MKRPSAGDGASAPVPPSSGILAKCPTLFLFLTDGLWDDGSRRELPTLLFFRDGDRFKVCVSDRALSRVAFVTGDTLEAILGTVEKDLAKDALDWRPAKNDGPRRK
jgi:hypothetical protein